MSEVPFRPEQAASAHRIPHLSSLIQASPGEGDAYRITPTHLLTPNRPMRILEFFCGIGGVAAAVGRDAKITAAIDISRAALEVYEANFPHPTVARELETIPASRLREWDADLWWMSPPCQPYTCRGRQRDIDDPRARSLLALIERIQELRPPALALENVPGFAASRVHGRLRDALDQCGYLVREHIVCPTELGIPMRRRRFYLTALCGTEPPARPAIAPGRDVRSLESFLDPAADEDVRLVLDPVVADRFRQALHVVDRADPAAVAHCFTSAYGRSYVRSGSYLACPTGVRRFSPLEILALMGFHGEFRLPPAASHERAWRLVGNSLCVHAVRHVLGPLLEGDRARR